MVMGDMEGYNTICMTGKVWMYMEDIADLVKWVHAGKIGGCG